MSEIQDQKEENTLFDSSQSSVKSNADNCSSILQLDNPFTVKARMSGGNLLKMEK